MWAEAGGLAGQGARPGQATFFRGWVSSAISFPVSLPKENKPKSRAGGRLVLSPGGHLQILGRQLQHDGFGVTCVTPVMAPDCPLWTSKRAALASGRQSSVDAQGLCHEDLRAVVIKGAHIHFLLHLAGSVACSAWGL